MNDIGNAISEVYRMDELASRNGWLNRIHPLVKLITTIAYIAVVVSFNKYNLTGLLGMVIYLIVLFVVGEISIKQGLYRLRFVLPLVCLVGIANPFFDKKILMEIGNIQVSAGVISMLTLMIKGIFSVLAAYLLVASTQIEKICYSLRIIKAPKVIVTTILLIYRYITVLLEEVHITIQSYKLRAPSQKGIHFKAWGSLVGLILLRSMDRAQSVYESMCLRGYDGEIRDGRVQRFGLNSFIFVLVVAIYLVLFRVFPVFEIVGSWFN